MKKIYLLILLMSCIFVTHASNPKSTQKSVNGWAKKHSLKKERSTETKKQRTAELKDAYINDDYPAFPLELEKIENYYGNDEINSTRKYTMDAAARTIQELYYHNYLGGEESVYSQIIYGYDTSNRIISLVTSEPQYDDNESKFQEMRKEQYSYDGQGNIASHIYQYYNIWNESWEGSKNTYEYDSMGNQTLNANYVWSDVKNDWEGRSKHVSEYNSKGNETLSAHYEWSDVKNDWVASEKSETTYAENGIAIKHVYSEWVESLNKWVETEIEQVTSFDGNGYPAAYTSKYYDSEETYQLSYTITGTLTFDSKGNLLRDEYEEFDEELHRISEIGFEEYAYDERGNVTLELYKFSEDGGTTYNGGKYVFKYDSNNNQTLLEYYSWGSSLNDWDYGSKTIYEYDNNNKKTLEERLYWDQDQNDWRKSSKETWEYDSKGRLVLSKRYYANDETNEYNQADYNKYFYKTEQSINSETQNASKAYIHKGILYVENNIAEIVSVYSLDGQLLHSIVKTESALQSDISYLPTDILVIKGSSGWSTKAINK